MSTPLRIGRVVRCGRSLTANDTASLNTSLFAENLTDDPLSVITVAPMLAGGFVPGSSSGAVAPADGSGLRRSSPQRLSDEEEEEESLTLLTGVEDVSNPLEPSRGAGTTTVEDVWPVWGPRGKS